MVDAPPPKALLVGAAPKALLVDAEPPKAFPAGAELVDEEPFRSSKRSSSTDFFSYWGIAEMDW